MSGLIYIINWPNLNLLGQREPKIYGTTTLKGIENICLQIAKKNNINLKFLQSNAEHDLINWIHDARQEAKGLIINPAAYSHTSIAILDALTLFEEPIIEVHISNIHKRESFRHHSYVSQKSTAVIAGFGIDGYRIALEKIISLCSYWKFSNSFYFDV